MSCVGSGSGWSSVGTGVGGVKRSSPCEGGDVKRNVNVNCCQTSLDSPEEQTLFCET